MLAGLEVEAVPVRRAGELEMLDGLVVPGGESTTIGRLAVTFGLLEPLQKLVAAGLPAYGSCAGMVLLADRVVDGRPGQPGIGGLDVTVRRNAFGRQVDSFEGDVVLTAAAGPLADGGSLPAVFIRAPWVESVGPDVEVLATVAAGPAAGRVVAVRSGGVLATSFHPELTGNSRVHELFVGMVEAARARREPPGREGGAS